MRGTAAAANKQSSGGMSFKDRQAQKKAQVPAKPVVSLADRRKQRGSMLDEENDDMLNKLKDDAGNFFADKKKDLEEITEDPEAFEDTQIGRP